LRYRRSTPVIDVLSEEDVVVASPTLVETRPDLGKYKCSLAEDGAKAIGPVGASESAAQPPLLTPERPAVSPLFGLFL